MCSSPDIPPPPPPPQEAKVASTDQLKRRKDTPGGGTLLTGPSGIQSASLSTGASTLLGS